MNLSRRSILTGLVAAPAIIRPGLLMPVRTWHDGIRGEMRWAVDPMPPGVPFEHYPVRAIMSDGRRWLPIRFGPPGRKFEHGGFDHRGVPVWREILSRPAPLPLTVETQSVHNRSLELP